MSTVNANTWATNIGRSPRPEDRIREPTLQEKMAILLKGKAKSASLMIGRRHTDSLRQALYTKDGLKGVQLHHIQDKTENEPNKHKVKACKKNAQNDSNMFKQTIYLTDKTRNPPATKRPLTAAPRYMAKPCHISNRPLAFVEDTLTIMSISGRISTQHKPFVKTVKQINTEDETDLLTFRAKSAPPSSFTTSPEPYINNRQHFHLPFFWRTRKNYHRKQKLKKQVTDLEGNGTKGTQLRSLLQNNRSSNCQQSCPYQCRNCFRACLASDTYMQQQLDRKKLRMSTAET